MGLEDDDSNLKSNAFYGNVSIKAYQLEKSLLLEVLTFPFVT